MGLTLWDNAVLMDKNGLTLDCFGVWGDMAMWAGLEGYRRWRMILF